jgi:hypothetical protein
MKTMPRFFLLIFVISTLNAACVGPPIGADRHEVAKEEPAAEAWRRAAMAAPRSGYRTIPGVEKLDPRVRGDSQYWAERFFLPETQPLHQTEVEIGAQPAKKELPDLVRYEYRINGLGLTVIESSNFTFVWVAGAATQAGEARAAMLDRVGAALFRMKADAHDWKLASVALQGDEERFSTNARTDAWDLRSWEDRTDAGVKGGVCYFLFFKRNPMRVGYENSSHWFGDAFRKSLGLW